MDTGEADDTAACCAGLDGAAVAVAFAFATFVAGAVVAAAVAFTELLKLVASVTLIGLMVLTTNAAAVGVAVWVLFKGTYVVAVAVAGRLKPGWL